jgi:hypothetical protein
LSKNSTLHTVKTFVIFLAIAVFTISAYGQINPEWKNEDLTLIKQLVKLDRNKPKHIEGFFKGSEKEEESLGFGWRQRRQSIGAGYISIWAHFFYLNDTIISYIIEADIPDKKELVNEYHTLYSKFFSTHSNGVYYYIHNKTGILQPLQ